MDTVHIIVDEPFLCKLPCVKLGNWAKSIVALRREPHIERLKGLGGVENRTYGTIGFNLRERNSVDFLDRLYEVVRDIVTEMENTIPS